MKDKTDCIIIEAASADFSPGLSLARNGMNVTVLEKNAIIGVVCNASIAKENLRNGDVRNGWFRRKRKSP